MKERCWLVLHSMFVRFAVIFFMSVFLLCSNAMVQAEEYRPGAWVHPSNLRPPLPDEISETPPSELDLPVVSPSPENLSVTPAVYVKKFKVVGSTVFSDAVLAKICAPYEGRKISSEELQELRHQLTLYYVNRGYINSGVIVPDQKVADGIVVLQVVEGELSEIQIVGNERLRSDYIRQRLALGAGAPLNVNHLQEKLQLLHNSDLIRKINAQLRPGVQPGQAVLNARVEEENPYVFGLNFSNKRSPSVGANRLEAYAAHRNLTGWGDCLGARYGFTEGTDDYSVSYAFPLTARDTTLKIYYDKSDATVVETPFDELDIESEAQTYGIALSHPFVKTLSEEFSLSLVGEKRSSKTFLLGQPFSFSQGVQDGESEICVLRFSQDWVRRSRFQAMALRSVFSWGIDAFDATINDSGPDGRFFAWLGQFQFARRFEKYRDIQMIFRTDLQLSLDPLLPLEKFSVGGADSVRGYRENQLVRDNGLIASLEFRAPVFRLPLPGLSKDVKDGMVQIAPFVDWGWAENQDGPTPEPETISSIGLGLRWDPSAKLHAQIYWGLPLRDVETSYEDLQDAGVHFQIDCRFM